MKVFPSYKNQSIGPLLGISVAVHTAFFGLSGMWKPAPEYGVVKAPSSMEIVLLEEPVQKKQEEILPVEKVLTSEKGEPAVEQEEPEPVEEVKKEEKKEEKEPQESVVAPPEKGAVSEAEPEYLRNPAPVYPRIARQRGWEGLVLLNVHVDAQGNAARVLVKESSGHRVLDEAAVKAVRMWKFKPASLSRHNFAAWIDIPVRFILEEA